MKTYCLYFTDAQGVRSLIKRNVREDQRSTGLDPGYEYFEMVQSAAPSLDGRFWNLNTVEGLDESGEVPVYRIGYEPAKRSVAEIEADALTIKNGKLTALVPIEQQVDRLYKLVAANSRKQKNVTLTPREVALLDETEGNATKLWGNEARLIQLKAQIANWHANGGPTPDLDSGYEPVSVG